MRARMCRIAATALTAGALVFASLAPASAQSATIRDKGDFKGPYDIQSLKVKHTRTKLVAKVDVRRLTAGPRKTVGLGIDRGRGYYRLVVRIGAKTKAGLLKTVDGGANRVKCPRLRVRGDFVHDRVVARIPRKCLKKPRKVRVQAEAGDLTRGLDYTRATRWLKAG